MASVYSAGDFRNGTTFEMDGNVFRVVEFQHVKPGKGSAFVRTKLKNVISGAVIEKTFNPSEKYPAHRTVMTWRCRCFLQASAVSGHPYVPSLIIFSHLLYWIIHPCVV